MSTVIEHDTPLAPAPWTVEPCDPTRDLWTVRTSQGLVIGPIFGERNAYLVAASPTMHEHLDKIVVGARDPGQRGSGLTRQQLRKLAAAGLASAIPPNGKKT